MTAEELVTLIREANSWDLGKVLRVFDGEGIYSYLINYGADSFAKKMGANTLTVDDLSVGDIIACGNGRYVVLSVENSSDFKGIYIFDGKETAYMMNCDLEDFKKTGESVAFDVKHIVDILQEADD